jgi:hypothetical protein
MSMARYRDRSFKSRDPGYGSFDVDERHYCRHPRCRSKLPAPVSNEHRAFCTRGCYQAFFRHRCLICEQAIERTTEHRKFCRKPRCRSTFRAAPERYEYPTGASTRSPSKNPTKPRVLRAPSADRIPPFRGARPWIPRLAGQGPRPTGRRPRDCHRDRGRQRPAGGSSRRPRRSWRRAVALAAVLVGDRGEHRRRDVTDFLKRPMPAAAKEEIERSPDRRAT